MGGASGSELRLAVDRAYLDGVELESIVPPPIRAEADGAQVAFIFASTSRGTAIENTFALRPTTIGWTRLRCRVAGGPAFNLVQWVLP